MEELVLLLVVVGTLGGLVLPVTRRFSDNNRVSRRRQRNYKPVMARGHRPMVRLSVRVP